MIGRRTDAPAKSAPPGEGDSGARPLQVGKIYTIGYLAAQVTADGI